MPQEIVVIKAGSLHVDAYTQRLFDKKLADKIEKNWDDNQVGALIVNKRTDGLWYIVDGQHRWVAAKAVKGEEYEFICVAHNELSIPEEAKLFLEIQNNRKSVPWADRYRVGVAANDPVSLRVKAALDSSNLKMGSGGSGWQVAAARSCMAVEEEYPGVLKLVFQIIVDAYGHERSAFDNNLIRALGYLIYVNDENFDPARMSQQLGKKPVFYWNRLSQEKQSSGGGSAGRMYHMARVLANAYNYNRKKNKIKGSLKDA